MQRRTALLSAGSMLAVVLTGATALGANIGILNSADDNPIGQLTSNAEVASTVAPRVVDVYVDDPAPEPGATVDPEQAEDVAAQEFTVDTAGTVEVISDGKVLRLGTVTAEAGWTWSAAQTSDSELQLTFESATTTYEFFANLESDGSISARVDQPVIQTIPAANPPTPGIKADDRDDEHYEDEDESEHEDQEDQEDQEGHAEEDHEEEHEGRDADD